MLNKWDLIKQTTCIQTGLTNKQKALVLLCNERHLGAPSRIQSEFRRAAVISLAANDPVMAEPSVGKIASFLSYQRKKQRGGVAVGRTTLQDVEEYASRMAHGEFASV